MQALTGWVVAYPPWTNWTHPGVAYQVQEPRPSSLNLRKMQTDVVDLEQLGSFCLEAA